MDLEYIPDIFGRRDVSAVNFGTLKIVGISHLLLINLGMRMMIAVCRC